MAKQESADVLEDLRRGDSRSIATTGPNLHPGCS